MKEKFEEIPFIPITRLAEQLGISLITIWRWRKRKLLNTVTIAGKVYVTREELNRFLTKAAAGEFGKQLKEA